MRIGTTIVAFGFAGALLLTRQPALAQTDLSVFGPVSEDSVSVSPELVLKDAQPAWQRIRQRYQSYSGTWSRRFVLKLYEEGVVYETGVFKKLGDTMLRGVKETHERTKSGTISKSASGLCINGQYVFEVSARSLDGPFKLTELARATSDVIAQKRVYLTSIPEELTVGRPDPFGIDELLANQSYQILSASRFEVNGSTLVLLSIQCDPKPPKDEQDSRWRHVRRGTFDVILDASHDYRVIAYREEASVPAPDRIAMVPAMAELAIRYEQIGDRKLKTVSDRIVKAADGRLLAHVVEEAEYDFTRPKQQEFYLTAFGLPEPIDFQASRGSRLWWWLACSGLTCIAIGLVLWRWYEWHQQKNKLA